MDPVNSELPGSSSMLPRLFTLPNFPLPPVLIKIFPLPKLFEEPVEIITFPLVSSVLFPVAILTAPLVSLPIPVYKDKFPELLADAENKLTLPEDTALPECNKTSPETLDS
eukprot:snap_masked-scaffold_29-processed-gene-4.35-mRNA-1 protein AED:1.00 eAED:1.00 QI:0/-1/0/0/-1/1/1/0/110